MRKVILGLALALLLTSRCFALDWKILHERADTLDERRASVILKSNTASVEDMYVLGLVYLNVHKDKEAKNIFSKILAINPGVIEAKWGLAETLRRAHSLNAAERMLDEVIKSNPQFSPAYITLAYIKYVRMDFDSSVKLALKVVKQGRGNVDLTNYVRAYCMYAGAKGMIAHYGGPLSKAINGTLVKPALEKAQSLQPNSTAVLFGFGSYYLLAPRIAGGDLEKAEEYLKRTVAADPLFADAYVRLSQLYNIKGDKEKQDYYFNKAQVIDPRNEFIFDVKSKMCKFICIEKQE